MTEDGVGGKRLLVGPTCFVVCVSASLHVSCETTHVVPSKSHKSFEGLPEGSVYFERVLQAIFRCPDWWASSANKQVSRPYGTLVSDVDCLLMMGGRTAAAPTGWFSWR